MHYKSILLAFMATALVAAIPTPLDNDALAPQPNALDTSTSLDTDAAASQPDDVDIPEALVPGEPLGLDIHAPNTATTRVLIPELQLTLGHTWPLIQCDPAESNKKDRLPKHFSCSSGLLPAPFPSNTSIFTWDTAKVRVGDRCHRRANHRLPPSWVCMATSNKRFAKRHLQRGFWAPINCAERPEIKHCGAVMTRKEIWKYMFFHWPAGWVAQGVMQEVVDENGRAWAGTSGW